MEEDKIIEEANVNDNYGGDVEEEELVGDGQQVEREDLSDDEDTQQPTSKKTAHGQRTKRRRKLLKDKVVNL